MASSKSFLSPTSSLSMMPMCSRLARAGLFASLTVLLLAGCNSSTTTVIEKPGPTVTVTKTSPPMVITRWRTRAVTVTVSAAPLDIVLHRGRGALPAGVCARPGRDSRGLHGSAEPNKRNASVGTYGT